MKRRIFCKGLTVAVILLFVGVGVQPAVATVEPETEIDIEPKDYLFQTIIDIANNPDLKNLLEQYSNDLFKFNIDRSVYRKLLLRNPRLMFNSLFTKPLLSVEYLNKCYNKGIEITNILGEDKVLEILENIKLTDTKFLNELINIVIKNDELSNRFETLKELNKDLKPVKPFIRYPILCASAILLLITIFIIIIFPYDMFYMIVHDIFDENTMLSKILNFIDLLMEPFVWSFFYFSLYILGFCLNPYLLAI